MVVRRLVLTSVALAAAFALAGCGGHKPVREVTDPAMLEDSAVKAEKVARNAALSAAPDAVLLSMDSQGVVMKPPPADWGFLYASTQNGRIYRVAVFHGKAQKPQDLVPLGLSQDAVDGSVGIGDLKVGSEKAYELGRAFLVKRDGSAPPNLAMAIALVELPGIKDSNPGSWVLTFTKGTSATGAQRVQVDGRTGQVTAGQ